MPDGSSTPAPRAIAIYDRASPVCPKCGRGIRVTVVEGSLLMTCPNSTRGDVCASKSLLVSIGSGSALVVPLSDDEFRELSSAGCGTTDALEALGLVGVPLTPAA